MSERRKRDTADSDLDKEEKEKDHKLRTVNLETFRTRNGTKRNGNELLNPETSNLDSVLFITLKRNLRYLPTDKETGENIKQKFDERLFIRYEHKNSPFYLYATSEALQTNINMLLDSELGKLFDTKNAKNVLDVQEIVRIDENYVYVSFNGLIYRRIYSAL